MAWVTVVLFFYFLSRLPDNQLGIKQKMLYSSSKKALKDKLTGLAKEIQCNDTDDLAWSQIVEKCTSKYDWELNWPYQVNHETYFMDIPLLLIQLILKQNKLTVKNLNSPITI